MYWSFLGVAAIVAILIYVVYKRSDLFKKAPPINEEAENRTQYEVKALHAQLGHFESLLSNKETELTQVKEQATILKNQLDQEIERNRTILSQKKSSEIRTGHIAETLAPFLMGNHDPKRLRWLGQPVDYIAFDKDGITFIEVKSGKSHLSHNQKYVKQLVLDKKVYWKEFRVRGKKDFRNFRKQGNGNNEPNT